MVEAALLSQIQEITWVETTTVSCNGRPPESKGEGHPLVYLAIGEEGRVVCPYCSRQFILVETSEG